MSANVPPDGAAPPLAPDPDSVPAPHAATNGAPSDAHTDAAPDVVNKNDKATSEGAKAETQSPSAEDWPEGADPANAEHGLTSAQVRACRA